MGSTDKADRKRRHLTSISPPSVPAKKPSLLPLTEDKKLDTTVLQFQNQKLSQKLEVQKIEISALENKLSLQKTKQKLYDKRLASVKDSWATLVNCLESTSLNTGRVGNRSGQDIQHSSASQDGVLSSSNIAFHRRLADTGATESCSANCSLSQIIGDGSCEKSKSIIRSLVAVVDDMSGLKDKLYSAVFMAIPSSSDLCMQRTSNDLASEVKNLRSNIGDLHLKHKSLVWDMCYHQENNIKIEVQLQCLRAELETTLNDLEESNHQLAVLKAEKDATMGLFYPVLSYANIHTAGDREMDKQKDLLDTELDLKKLVDQSSSRIFELKHLYEERIGILKKLLQSTLRSLKCISSSNVFVSVSDQLEKSKVELIQYHALYEKLQAERDNIAWHEREANIKDDLADVFRRSCAVADSRIHDLGVEIQQNLAERRQVEARLQDSSEDPGRKNATSNFKALVSSFPEDMNIMQSQLSKYKETAANVPSLRAHVQCVRIVLDRKVKELETMSAKSISQGAEKQRLHAVVRDLKQTEKELNLYVEMYKRECTLNSDVLDARDLDFKSWAQVEGLKSSLDEYNLEFRVKEAIKAEAISQQSLAAAEAEIAELREKCDASKREMTALSDSLKSKSEENEAYLSEIETTGQAYDDMQKQNQQLLQQIIERDDYNIKLVLEGVKACQMRDALLMEKLSIEKKIQQASLTADFFAIKAARIEDQVKVCSDLVRRYKEDRRQNSIALEAFQKRLLDEKKTYQHGRESLEVLQSKVNSARARLADSQIEREKERFEKKRLQEDLEAVKRKASHLAAQLEGGSSTVGKLRKEMQEYKEILKCSICHDRAKEVVITKCYHLFCNPCIQRIIETRHRKCPVCATGFGPNDVKPVIG
ncbi:hypothetical protein V2J09_022146 [Rumex salicifolius]